MEIGKKTAINTLSSASHGINSPQMMFFLNYLEGD